MNEDSTYSPNTPSPITNDPNTTTSHSHEVAGARDSVSEPQDTPNVGSDTDDSGDRPTQADTSGGASAGEESADSSTGDNSTGETVTEDRNL